MFGYVKPAYPELKVRENELYRAYYCGLCRALGKCTGQCSRMTLNYDLVFLAMLRHAVLGERSAVRKRRCVVHPLKSRPSVEMTESLRYSACVCAVLSRAKLEDTKSDERGIKRIGAGLLTPAADSMLRRAEEKFPGLYGTVTEDLAVLSELEKRRSPGIDESADAFGVLLGHIMSAGIDGAEGRVLSRIGHLTGKFIYITDAADDAADDVKSGNYNPFVLTYGEDLCETRDVWDFRGRMKLKTVLRRDIAEGIMIAGNRLISDLCAAAALLDFSAAPELEGIVTNICSIGMPGEMRRVLGLVEKPRLHEAVGSEKENDRNEGTLNYD